MNQSNNLLLFPYLLLGWYFFVLLSTYLLSYFSLLNRFNVVVLTVLFLTIVILKLRKKFLILSTIKRFDFLIIILLLLTFIQGLFSAPNTTDSMVYHLPRVMNWIQQQSVFQSSIYTGHDYLPPFGDYLLLHLYLLFGSDRFLFLSQWLAWIAIALTSKFLLQLFSGKKVSNSSLLIITAMPIMILQSTSTQIDLVTGFIYLLQTYFAIRLFKKVVLQDVLIFSALIGLGFITRSTLLIFSIVPALLVIYSLIKQKYLSQQFSVILFALLLFLIIVFPFLLQNLNLYGSLLGEHRTSTGIITFINTELSIGYLLAGVVKNLFLHIPLPFINEQITAWIMSLFNYFMIELNYSGNTWFNEQFKVQAILFPHEDIAANPIQLLIVFIAGFFYLKEWKKISLFSYLFFSSIFAFFIFSAVLKWQPWHTRLHLPILLVLSILSVNKLLNFKKLLLSFSLISYCLAVMLILFNYSRPYVSYQLLGNFTSVFLDNKALPESFLIRNRSSQYFNPRPYWESPYNNIVLELISDGYLNGNICLSLMDSYEYPFWLLLQKYNTNIDIEKNCNGSIYKLYTVEYPLENFSDQRCYKTDVAYGYACLVKL